MKPAKYLVRLNDFHIFELDNSNNCYRSYSTRDVTYPDGTRPNAKPNYTFEYLTENFDYMPIKNNELSAYEKRHDVYLKWQSWANRSDGHGGIKGGTMEEFLEMVSKEKN